MRGYYGILLASGMALLFGCTKDLQLAGSVSETTNGSAVGTIVNQGGLSASRAQVKLLPVDYNPVKNTTVIPIDTTDALGNYAFTKVAPGEYVVQAVHIDKRTSVIIRGIHIAGDTVTVPPCTLLTPGSIKVMLPAAVDAVTGYVYVPGTTVVAFLNNRTDFVVLDSVPAGTIPEVSYSSIHVPTSTVIRYNVPVVSGDMAVIWNPSWKYAKQLFMNTTASGANVAGNAVGFPVLVRLTSGNFVFSQAQSTGADIRITKPDNTFLPYEIERWDPVTELAEVWVMVDTIFGNDGTHCITMYWGNAGAIDSSNGAAVFDTAAEFAGVWHLGPPAGSIVPDATANGNNGTATATVAVSGAIGMAQMFDGTSSLIQASGPASDKLNFPDTGTYSVSAWVKTNVLDSVFHGIVYKSNFQYGLQMRPVNSWEFFTYIDKSRWEMSRSPVPDESWHAITGVRKGSKQYLYVDGVCADSSIVILTTNLPRATDQPLEIGHCPDGGTNPDRFFNGIIDEVRISKIALGADWIKLCYMNQKEQDALVKW